MTFLSIREAKNRKSINVFVSPLFKRYLAITPFFCCPFFDKTKTFLHIFEVSDAISQRSMSSVDFESLPTHNNAPTSGVAAAAAAASSSNNNNGDKVTRRSFGKSLLVFSFTEGHPPKMEERY